MFRITTHIKGVKYYYNEFFDTWGITRGTLYRQNRAIDIVNRLNEISSNMVFHAELRGE